jgi:hypothetical protein
MVQSLRKELAMMSLQHALLVTIGISCAIGPAGAESSVRPPAAQAQAGVHLKNELICEQDETACLDELSGTVERDGDHLRVKLANGKTKVYTTTRQACDAGIYEKCLQYRLVGYYPRQRLFLVHVGFYLEGGTYLLASARTGEHARVAAIPHLSPSGKRLAVVSASESGDENSVEILSTASDPPKSEWRYVVPEDEYALYEFGDWDGDDRLVMRLTTQMGQELLTGLSVEAVRSTDGWQLTSPRAQ